MDPYLDGADRNKSPLMEKKRHNKKKNSTRDNKKGVQSYAAKIQRTINDKTDHRFDLSVDDSVSY